ncbi:MAG: PEP-CTERM sorting domain-containing protein, partial [Planctomycetota bacterium]
GRQEAFVASLAGSSTLSGVVVPEPGGPALVLLGIIALAGRRGARSRRGGRRP